MTGGVYGRRRPLPRQGSMTRGACGRQRSLAGGACGPQRSLAGYFKSPYLANLAGVPDARGRWIKSELACRMTGPLDQK